MNIRLEKGKALIITGGRGVGKTTMAIETAVEHGTYKTTSLRGMQEGNFALGRILDGEPDTVIIEDALNEFTNTQKVIDTLKQLIVFPKTIIDRKGMVPVKVRTPNFIICTGVIDPLKIDANDRRFTIVSL